MTPLGPQNRWFWHPITSQQFLGHEKFQKKSWDFTPSQVLDFSPHQIRTKGTQVDLTDVFQRVQAKLDQIPSDHCTVAEEAEKKDLVGGWTNPSWKICSSKMGSSPGLVKIKNLWNHQPEIRWFRWRNLNSKTPVDVQRHATGGYRYKSISDIGRWSIMICTQYIMESVTQSLWHWDCCDE